MPRPTKQVLELRHCIDKLTEQLAEQGQIVFGLRKDLEGACHNSKRLEHAVIALHQEANKDDQHIKTLEDEFVALQMKHDRVCRMWAEMASQFDTVEVHKKEMSA